MLMLDLCCGLKGASAAMRDRGWTVVTLDIDPRFGPDICIDLRCWSWDGPRPDLIWVSPPCVEFSRLALPWIREKTAPDMSIVEAAWRVIREAQPRAYVIENVRGAVSYIGKPAQVLGPYHLWGRFPPLGQPLRAHVRKENVTHNRLRAALRALIPYELSLALALAVEQQLELPLVLE